MHIRTRAAATYAVALALMATGFVLAIVVR